MGNRYHVKIAGQGFLVKPGSYRRTALSLLPAPGTQNTTLSMGWRRWHQSDWQGGDGHRNWDGGAGNTGRWWAGYGVEVGESGNVRLGSILSDSFTSTEGGFAAMLTFRGRLYALPTSSGSVYSFDGTNWTVDWDSGKDAMSSMARHRDQLYAGSGSDGVLFARDGDGWLDVAQVAGAASVDCMASYEVWDPAARATVPRLFLGCSFTGGEAKVYQWDGATLAELHSCRESKAEAMIVYGGRLYVATSDRGNGLQGRLLCFDGRSSSGEWSEVAWLSDSFVAGWTIFDNLLFCGSGAGGKIWAFDGERMEEAYRLQAAGLEYSEPLRALTVCNGRLYVGYSHPTKGAALLCKLPAGVGGRVSGSGGSGAGWYTPSAAGNGGSPEAMAVYGGNLYLGCGAEGAASIYRREAGLPRSSGLIESSFFDAGQPEAAKLLRTVALSHDKLLGGQRVEVKFAMEGSDSFQQMEEFGSLRGCDQALTTADWRSGESLVRLKGMPIQGFAGKRPGDLRVPHLARKLAASNPQIAPAYFLEEFSQEDYDAVATVGDGVAVTTDPSPGGYAHQLFEFDLTGLTPAGVHPRAVCYGLGDYGGAAAPGVILRIWNHASGLWDVVGSNSAASIDSVVDRTVEASTSNFGRYVGPAHRLYLSLRSSYSGSPANPATMGADLVELAALWAEEGEAVSEPLQLPVPEPVSVATLTLLESHAPAETGIELYMSVDGGELWEPVADGIEHSFALPGSSLRWKARLSSADGLDTPWIGRLKVDYITGVWLQLGMSDTEGSTSALLPFESGVTARRIAFRVELRSDDPSGGPALTAIALEYALEPETRRRWEMELSCEGVAGVPLRLLDGSTEVKTGNELSRLLWQARARGITGFEDLDGRQYQVWFEGLEESLGGLDQQRGPQTVARCRLTEC
jgi:hypothetical protein